MVQAKSRFKAVEEDHKDNAVLNAAYDCRAKYIVSGDKHLLKMKRFKGIKILSVAEMLEILNG